MGSGAKFIIRYPYIFKSALIIWAIRMAIFRKLNVRHWRLWHCPVSLSSLKNNSYMLSKFSESFRLVTNEAWHTSPILIITSLD